MPALRHKVTSWIWVLHSLKPLRIIFPDDNRMELKKKNTLTSLKGAKVLSLHKRSQKKTKPSGRVDEVHAILF